MTQSAQAHEQRSGSETEATVVPAFKPVALPALAAAVRSSQPQPSKPKEVAPPAILRKESVLSR